MADTPWRFRARDIVTARLRLRRRSRGASRPIGRPSWPHQGAEDLAWLLTAPVSFGDYTMDGVFYQWEGEEGRKLHLVVVRNHVRRAVSCAVAGRAIMPVICTCWAGPLTQTQGSALRCEQSKAAGWCAVSQPPVERCPFPESAVCPQYTRFSQPPVAGGDTRLWQEITQLRHHMAFRRTQAGCLDFRGA